MRATHHDLYKSFAEHNVRYVVIGGVAAIAHGSPRMTGDLDIFVEATLENAHRLLQALRDASMGTAYLIEPEDILAKDVTIFDDWIPLDVHTAPLGLAFAEAWERRTVVTMHDVPVNILSREDLIASKQAAGRPKDIEDVEFLQQVANQERREQE